MTTPTDSPEQTGIEQAEDELRQGIESSRHLVQQTRMLIELSECDSTSFGRQDDCPVGN